MTAEGEEMTEWEELTKLSLQIEYRIHECLSHSIPVRQEDFHLWEAYFKGEKSLQTLSLSLTYQIDKYYCMVISIPGKDFPFWKRYFEGEKGITEKENKQIRVQDLINQIVNIVGIKAAKQVLHKDILKKYNLALKEKRSE